MRAAPLGRIDGFALLANGKIQCRGLLTAGVADGGYDVAGVDEIPRIFKQALVMPIEGQVAVTMVKDNQQSCSA